jgi:hypothetical protein
MLNLVVHIVTTGLGRFNLKIAYTRHWPNLASVSITPVHPKPIHMATHSATQIPKTTAVRQGERIFETASVITCLPLSPAWHNPTPKSNPRGVLAMLQLHCSLEKGRLLGTYSLLQDDSKQRNGIESVSARNTALQDAGFLYY